jgi:tripartite-type tricarboxylate transporter receptor subunit TctC
MIGRRRLLFGAATLAAVGQRAFAQGTFPTKPLRMIVPYPPGGTTDILARALGALVGKELGQSVVIDNRPGGATNIGSEAAIRSPADGHTIYFGTSGLASNPHFGPVPAYDAFRDLIPVAPVSSMSFLVAAGPSFAGSDPASFVSLARTQPRKVSIGSGALEVQVAQLSKGAGIELMHVPYKGGALAATDASGGHVDTVIALVPALLSFVQSGKLKAIGVAARSRVTALPGTPTFIETGVPAVLNNSWFGIFVPAGTPAPIVERLGAAVRASVSNAELVSKMSSQGVDLISGSADDLASMLRRDFAEYEKMAKEMK